MMKLFPGWMSVRSAICAVLLFSVATKSVAQLGPATAEDNDADCMWRSTLTPNPPGAVANTLSNLLVQATTGHPVFDFKMFELSFDLLKISVLQYSAWVNERPAVMVGGLNQPAQKVGKGTGGALISVEFEPPEEGPPRTIHWLQFVRTNLPEEVLPQPFFRGQDGFNYFIDNLGSARTPFYDVAGGAANGTNFLDLPFSFCLEGCNGNFTTTFNLFAAEALPNGKFKVYRNGIEWGYNFQCIPVDMMFEPVPEASTFLAAGGLLLIVSVHRVRKRRGNVARHAVGAH